MENNSVEKKVKLAKPSGYGSLRIRKETKKRVMNDLARVNKKDYGRKVRVDEYISVALGLINADHIQSFQEASLSNADRLERDYRNYVIKNGQISKDEYLGKRLMGELVPESNSQAELPDKTKNS